MVGKASRPRWHPWLRAAVGLGLVVAAVVLVFGVRVQDQLRPLLTWTQQHQLLGAITFVAVYVLCTVLFIPGLVLSLGGGLVFGLAFGTLLVWTGACVGAVLAFLLGRSLMQEYIASRVHKHPKWNAIEQAVQEEGWQIALLLRLAPVVPFNALNYALGVTSLPLPTYAWVTAVGILPGTLIYVYFGSVAGSLDAIMSGEAGPTRAVAIATLVVSGVAILLAGTLITMQARRILNRKMLEQGLEHDRGLHDTEA